jgi:hypothetical protein
MSNRVKEYWGIRTLKDFRGGCQSPSTNLHSISTLNIIFVVEPPISRGLGSGSPSSSTLQATVDFILYNCSLRQKLLWKASFASEIGAQRKWATPLRGPSDTSSQNAERLTYYVKESRDEGVFISSVESDTDGIGIHLSRASKPLSISGDQPFLRAFSHVFVVRSVVTPFDRIRSSLYRLSRSSRRARCSRVGCHLPLRMRRTASGLMRNLSASTGVVKVCGS